MQKTETAEQRYTIALNKLREQLVAKDVGIVCKALNISEKTYYNYMNGKGKNIGIYLRINNALTKIIEQRSKNDEKRIELLMKSPA